MIFLNKRGKIVVAAVVFAAIAAAGYFIERFERNAYVEEVVAKEDAVSYVEDSAGSGGKININTADKNELSVLHGVGASLAERIISYRSENGSFETIEEIMKVPGISEKKFEDIKSDICVE